MRAIAAGIVAGVVVVATVVTPPSSAQPAPSAGSGSAPAPAPDIPRARELYQAAEAAMKDGRFADAARDYGVAFEITRDPVLFFKLGSANDRGKKCNVALIYYRRYLREARPAESFVRLTRARIAACGGNPDEDAGTGSAAPPASPPTADPRPEPDGGPEPEAGGLGSAGAPAAKPPPSPRHRLAWLLIGGSIASFTAAAVLAYSANAAENDVADLYIGIGGNPPEFDGRTRRLFDDLVAEGERYERLSWIGFGLAGALAIGATIRFLTDDDPRETPTVTPAVTPGGAGVTATVRF